MTNGDHELRDRLHALFLEELDDQLGRIEHGLDVLAGSLPAAPVETVDELFRCAHSLKGAAQAVGAAAVVTRCHDLEDGLARARDDSGTVDEQLVGHWAEAARDLRLLAQELGTGSAGSTPAEDQPPGAGGSPASSAAGAPRAGEPVGLRSHGDTGAVRVERAKFDDLLAAAGQLVTSSFGAESLLNECEALRDRFEVEADQWRRGRYGEPGSLDTMEAGLRRLGTDLARVTRTAEAHRRTLRSLVTDFADTARRARTVPFATATSGLSWLVRDLARSMGKEARIVISAADVDIDKELVSAMADALRHLVRNAMDHGLEAATAREDGGKPRVGTVTVSAELTKGGIEVHVRDDGRGVDVARLRAAATDLGVELDAVADDEARVLFLPGLSTAAGVGQVSGRGVGLDAVRAAVEAMRGSVWLHSVEGEGTDVRIVIPLASSTLRAVLVRTAGQTIAVTASAIETAVRLPPDLSVVAGREVLTLGDEVLPVAPLSVLLGWADPQASGTGSEERLGLRVSSPEGAAIVAVGEVVSEQEIVLRAVPERLAGVPLLLGFTQTGDGSVAPVLNGVACARAAVLARTGAGPAAGDDLSTAARPREVLLVEDTLLTRELERDILETAGHVVTTAGDGEQAWQLLQSRRFDVVVSDVNMPGMDGIALCRAIRGSRRLEGLPVLLVTSLHTEADRLRGLEAGADGYVTKAGLDRGELVAAVERLL